MIHKLWSILKRGLCFLVQILAGHLSSIFWRIWTFSMNNVIEHSIMEHILMQAIQIFVKSVSKVGCVFPMIVVSILPHAEFGPNDQWEDAAHFKMANAHWYNYQWLLIKSTEYRSLTHRTLIQLTGQHQLRSATPTHSLHYAKFRKSIFLRIIIRCLKPETGWW